MATIKGQAKSEPATPIIREDPGLIDQLTPTQPTFQSLSYTKVRDFAYPPSHPLHYGPPPIPSIGSTPGSARDSGLFSGANGISAFLGWWNPAPGAGSPGGRRMSDSAAINRDPRGSTNHPPPLKFADGPPWFEDEDLVSPVVITQKHRKHKSSLGLPSGRTLSKDAKMSSITENMKDGEYGNGIEIPEDIGEPGGTFHTATGEYYEDGEEGEEEYEGEEDEEYGDESRYSRDYHFSIADPDEEMHGKAVALFDFRRENDNELELVEGQVIWVSYRHGQGWLVAEDPRTGESGLVPEEYVRLFKETPFESSPDEFQPQEAATAAAAAAEPQSAKPKDSPTHTQAIQSHFSTSSKDLERYPTEQLLDSSYRLGSPPPTSRLGNDRKDSTRSNDSMDIDLISPMTVVPNNASTIDRELFAIQQRKLESGKVLNGKDKSEQEEYQILHHKSPSMSGKASPAVSKDRDGDAAMSLTGTPPTPTSKLPGVTTSTTGEDNRGRPVEAR
ncbi:HOG (high osmolarity glycerol) pathway protein [Orbilia oligospora]|uniref:HOG (High osmolarity glycerol) pathway protein n=1 Tax=Orbilia oligospora TaxID=2813651 RepID=A0A7C8NII0_ORBOL|nr:HOG (high osmolarity glycerol) pathway protein [Orbilia oligospora]KAF3092079.1 HOG (high osmolarity glycerol) pathway protein [Orbilia oligospora]KAF3107890.1 HOG (high osmolarity glycerol) pathway protein [Orbilia oligospora]KAF3118808.1 HOG (high osmolarity glycerol) pathway protein [Orbilia oligospora]KAF3145913.1 HOG (high osmolarity glycerol) pathway protein [Orbilia oligospora]